MCVKMSMAVRPSMRTVGVRFDFRRLHKLKLM